MQKNKQDLIKILDLPIQKIGYILIDIKFINRFSNQIIQLFIHRSQGIEFEDCVIVNNLVLGIMSKENIFKEDYTLEISSPGIFMKLQKPEHFKIFKGERIKVILLNSIQSQKIAIGKIVSSTNEGINLNLDNTKKDIHILFSQISKANLEPKINI